MSASGRCRSWTTGSWSVWSAGVTRCAWSPTASSPPTTCAAAAACRDGGSEPPTGSPRPPSVPRSGEQDGGERPAGGGRQGCGPGCGPADPDHQLRGLWVPAEDLVLQPLSALVDLDGLAERGGGQSGLGGGE